MKKFQFNFIACSDLHIRRTNPISRKDIFYSSLKRKISWLFNLAQINDAYIVCGGDVFENVSVSHNTIKDIVKLALKYNIKFLTVFGQHDLRYHVYNSNENTPLAILLASLNTQHLDECPFENEFVAIKGASWGQNIPSITKGKINILATHRMVSSAPMWPGHIDFQTPELLLSAGYDIIVSGDNHQSFVHEKNNRFVINSGSLTRSRIDQINYLPRVALFKVTQDSISYEWIDVPVRIANTVFKEEKIEEYNTKLLETKKQLDEFTTQLNNYKLDKPDYMYNLMQIKNSLTDAATIKSLDNIIGRVQNG